MDSLKKQQKISALLNAAVAEHKNNNIKSALDKYNNILKTTPKHSEVLHLAGLAYFQSDQKELAIKYIKKAIKLNNQEPKFYNSLGMIFLNQKPNLTTVEDLNKIVKSDSQKKINSTEVQNTIHIKHLLAAEKAYIKSSKLAPNNHLTYFNIGSIQRIINKPYEAIKNLHTAISLNNHHKESYNELGLTYFNLGQFEDAHNAFNNAIKIDENFFKAQADNSLVYLSEGNFKEGWQRYETRGMVITRKADNIDALKKIPLLDSEYKSTNTPLIILPEQGVGDEIMFASLIPEFTAKYSGAITLLCTTRLIPIFKRSFPGINISNLKKIPTRDNQSKIFIGSLPKFLRNSESDFIPADSYLIPNDKTKKHYQNKYSSDNNLRIGISWRSGNPLEGTRRSINLSSISNLLSQPNCSFFNLQYGDISQEVNNLAASIGVRIINDTEIDPLKDLDSYISFASTLDLIITVDNSTAHIGGALGIPTWVMLPYSCDWRWMRDRDDSLWYKSLRLYRQKETGDWSNVIKEVTNDLTNRNIQPKAESQPPVAANPVQNQPQKEKEQTNAIAQKQKSIKTDRKIAFLNDTTAWYHWGCTATSEAIRKRIIQSGYKSLNVPINFSYNFQCTPQNAEDFDSIDFFNNACKIHKDIFNAINGCDQVVINGEGSIHHLSKVSLSLLYMAYACKKFLNKPVHIINHSPYPGNVREPQDNFAFQLYKAVYNQLDYIAIREHISHKLMTSYGVDAALSFDCLPITVTEDYKPEKLDAEKNIVISGSVSFSKDRITDLGKLMQHFHQQGYKIKVLHGAKAFPAQDDLIFIQELQKLSFKNYEVIDAKSLTEWLDCINSANIFISGRFHHSLAAIYLETSCVMMESNTLKNVALAETFNMPEPIRFDSDNFFDELLERTEKALKSEPVDIELRKSLLQRSEVNFERIPEFG